MKVITLAENTACRAGLAYARGLSVYVETEQHKVLFDAGPDPTFAFNAEKLGVDLAQVDTAVLSHGHSDHSDGLLTFFEENDRAQVYVRPEAFAPYAAKVGENEEYIGMAPKLAQYQGRFVPVSGDLRLDEELALFGARGDFPAFDASARLKRRLPDGTLIADTFAHEQDLIVTSGGKNVLLAGCAHRGIVNILRSAEAFAGCQMDAVFGGFHLFQLDPNDPASEKLVRMIGAELQKSRAVFYTGHCTGDFAFDILREMLGDRLQNMAGGTAVEL